MILSFLCFQSTDRCELLQHSDCAIIALLYNLIPEYYVLLFFIAAPRNPYWLWTFVLADVLLPPSKRYQSSEAENLHVEGRALSSIYKERTKL